LFRRLTATAFAALSAAAFLAIAGFAWNSRRLRLPATSPLRRSRVRKVIERSIAHAVAPSAAVRAGFSFALQVLTRSPPHRVAMSAAAAVGLSVSIVLAQAQLFASGSGAVEGGLPPPGVFAAQLAVIAALVGGFRHAIRLPATLPANWTIQMAWHGDRQLFLAGVRHGGALALIAAPLAAFLPVHVALVGWWVAFAHAIVCGLVALALLDGLLVGFRVVPFASPYMPLVSSKVLWPASIVASFAVPLACGTIEREAFDSPWRTVALIAALGAISIGVNQMRWRHDAGPESLIFEELATTSTQRLGLHDRMMG
jgi:hypothetical protein